MEINDSKRSSSDTESLDNGINKKIVSNGSKNFCDSKLLVSPKKRVGQESSQDDCESSSSTENEEEEMMMTRKNDDTMQSNLKSGVETTTTTSGDIKGSDKEEDMSVKQAESQVESSSSLSCSNNSTPTCSSKKGRNDDDHHPPTHDGIPNDSAADSNGLDSSQEEDLDDHCDDPVFENDDEDKKSKEGENTTRQAEVDNNRESSLHRVIQEKGDVKGVTGDDGDEHREQRIQEEGQDDDDKESNLQLRRRSLRRRRVSGEENITQSIKKQRSSSSELIPSSIASKEEEEEHPKKTEAAKQTDNNHHGIHHGDLSHENEDDENVFNDRKKHRPSNSTSRVEGGEENDHHHHDDEQQRQRSEEDRKEVVNDERDLTMKRKRKRSHPDRHQENEEEEEEYAEEYEEDISSHHDVLVTELSAETLTHNETSGGEATSSSKTLCRTSSSSLDLRSSTGRLLRSTQPSSSRRDNKEGKTGEKVDSSLYRPHHHHSLAVSSESSTTSQLAMKDQKDSEDDDKTDEEEEEMREEGDDDRPTTILKSGDNSNTSPAALISGRKKFKDDTTTDRDWICPVCNENQRDQHTFTIHIRQHNPTDHSHTCSICGKTLSSASSLDRHMLIHSGERPFKCRICNMAFTTNGNMHRHMRTHGLELNDDLTPIRGRGPRSSGDSSGRRRLSQATRPRIEVDESSIHSEDSGHVKSTTSVERSPGGGGSDSSASRRVRPELDGLSAMKNLMNSKFPFPASQAASSGGLGFFDLSFTDFTSKKFPSIAQSFCEHNLRKSASAFHEYECVKCHRGFPSGSALNLHESAVHSSSTFCGFCRVDLTSPDNFIKHMFQHQLEGLRHGSDAVSSFLQNNPFAQSSLNDKEGFMAMLQLHNREQERLQALQLDKESRGENVSDPLNLAFDDPAYFVHAKPSPKSISKTTESAHGNNKKSDSEIDVGKATDLADIQSIISVTKSGNHLKQMSTASPSDGSASEEESMDVAKFDSKREEGSMSSNDGIGSNTEEERAMTAQDSSKGSPNGSVSNNNNNNNNDLSCKVCGVEFKNTSALKKHSRGHLQGGGHNYSCHLCSYTSLDKSTLVRHLRTHNGERPFQCVICKYAFTTKANCERHVRKRHKKFSKAEIKASMQFNTDLLASSSASIDSLNLNNSSLSLIGSRNRDNNRSDHHDREDLDSAADSSDHFPNASDTICKYCKVDFKFNRVLKHHLRSLNNSCNRKPYICSVCTIGFSTKNNCLRHVLRQHPQFEGDKAIACIIFNGTAMNATSYAGSEDFSDDDSSLHAKNGSIYSANKTSSSTSLLKPPAVRSPSSSSSSRMLPQTGLNKNLNDRNSSLAALCSVGASKPLNMSSKPEHDAYDGGDEFDENNNDEQPFDLSRNSSGRQDKTRTQAPLDLTSHALDLSCKQSPPANKPKTDQFSFPSTDDVKASDLSVRSAASTLLALQSMASARFPMENKPAFPAATAGLPFLAGLPHSMATAFAQNPLFYHQAMMNAQQGLHPSLMHPSSAASAVVDNLLKLSAAAAAANGLGRHDSQAVNPMPSVSPSPASLSMLAKNERHFTCKYCQAGFTLKSNMERHIKRKHPSFARASRSVRSASCGSSGPKDGSPLEGSPEVVQPQPSFDVRKSNGTAVMHTLSNATRAALRDVLALKAMNGVGDTVTEDEHDDDFDSSEEIDVEATSNETTTQLTNHGDNLTNALNHILQTQNALRPENTNYPTTESNQSKNTEEEEESNSDGVDQESDHESSSSSFEDPFVSKESRPSKTSPRRSAYTDSPNSVTCPYCSRKFPWSSSLRRHILTHTGAKPYKCPKCPILFTTKSNCERHLIRKHKTITQVVDKEDSSMKKLVAPHDTLDHWSRQSGSSLLIKDLQSLRKSPSGSAESPPSDELASPPPEDTDSGKSVNSLEFRTENGGNVSRSEKPGEPSSSSDLIQSLLGIKDSKMLDEMLGSADSAARLLGIRTEVLKTTK